MTWWVTPCLFLIVMAVPLFGSSMENWTASGGFGLTVGAPGGGSQILVSPQLEYTQTPRILVGPLIQAGIAASSTFGISGAVRYLAGNHAKVRPCFEAGVGVAFATSVIDTSSVGILLHAGMGVDFQVDANFAVGTLFRVNLAPPLSSFFVSWPLVVARFAL